MTSILHPLVRPIEYDRYDAQIKHLKCNFCSCSFAYIFYIDYRIHTESVSEIELNPSVVSDQCYGTVKS